MGQAYSEVRPDSSKDKILDWLRVSRKTNKEMVVEWRWKSPEMISRQLEKAQILCVYGGGTFAKSHLHQVSLQQTEQEISNLHTDTIYRICLQIEPSKNFTDEARVVGIHKNDYLYCIDASTKQPHLPAVIGSTIGAVLAVLIVFLLVFVSKKRQKSRKHTKNHTSTPSKLLMTETHYDANSVSKMEMDEYGIYDGSEERRSSVVSEETFTTLPPPPPPPPNCEVTPLLDKHGSATVTHDNEDDDDDDKKVNETGSLTPDEAEHFNSNVVLTETALVINHCSTQSNESSPTMDTKPYLTVIHMNDSDEYAIDLQQCNNTMSRLHRANTHPLPSSSCTTTSTNTINNLECNSTNIVGSHPALYTQIIETL